MFVKSKLVLVTFSLVIITTSADQGGCRTNSDCGNGDGFICDPNSRQCQCPGDGKKYVAISTATPQCQPLARIGDACIDSLQCNSQYSEGGELSRCGRTTKKCECYDTVYSGRDVVKPYRGTCYRATAVSESCLHDNQCKAFIGPEDNVHCTIDTTTNEHVCKCIAGKHCEEKTENAAGALKFGIASLATFTLLGLLATKVVQ